MLQLILAFILLASAAFGQVPVAGPSLSGGGGSSVSADGTSILDVSSVFSVNTAVMQSRATAQAGTSTYCAPATGNDTYTCGLTPALTAYTTGMCLVVKPDTANTGTATLNVDALGSVSVLGPFGSALADGDLPTSPWMACYNGTAFIKQGFSYVVYGGANTLLSVKAGSVQSSNLQEWQGPSGTALSFVTLGGTGYFPVINLDGWWTLSQTSGGGISFGSGHMVAWGSGGTNAASGTVSGDTALGRNAAGVVEANSGTLGTLRDFLARQYKNTPVAVGSLQTCNAGNAGSVASVNDANAPAWGVTVANGGAAFALVVCNGSNWTVTGK